MYTPNRKTERTRGHTLKCEQWLTDNLVILTSFYISSCNAALGFRSSFLLLIMSI